jgi:hypothetical protein
MSLWVLPTQPELTYIRRQYGDIMISTSLLTGATLYVGYKTYRAAQRAAQPAWWRGVMARLDKLRTAMGGERQAATVARSRIRSIPSAAVLLCPLAQAV